jgi:Archaeal ATPase.
MSPSGKVEKLRRVITENLRVQRAGAPTIPYIDVAHALPDARARQNHVIFGRRGCGKTLLLQESGKQTAPDEQAIYLNCEDFKHHTFPNVLLEALESILAEMQPRTLRWWGKKKRAKQLIKALRSKLGSMRTSDDERSEKVVEKKSTEAAGKIVGGVGGGQSSGVAASAGAQGAGLNLTSVSSTSFNFGGEYAKKQAIAVETAYERTDSKIRNLNMLLPQLKADLRQFFNLSSTKTVFLQIDDFYHLSRVVQPHVMDYIHRLCKDLPIYFKVATLRHATVLYAERGGQPVGAQERHDYQPINVDFTFQDFPKTERQVREIFHEFAALAGMSPEEFEGLFKGDGFRRLVIAGGGVPRDCLSLFLEALATRPAGDSRIGKDDVRQLSFSNFEKKIEELKRDSQRDEQDILLKGIYVIRKFCLDKQTSVFFIPERLIQEVELARDLIFRLLDYRIIHAVGSAFTHKSVAGSFQGFMIDIGSYAFMRKLAGKMNEIDLASPEAKETMRSVPILSEDLLREMWHSAPEKVETKHLTIEEAA